MVGIDGNGRDGGVEKRRYSSKLFYFFSLLLFLSFFLFSPSFFLASLFFFFKNTSKFQKILHKIMIWRSFFVEV